MKKGFTLIEMLVVIGIIGLLVGGTIAAYSGIVAQAQKTRANELVHEAATALVEILQEDDSWPRPILAEGSSGEGKMNEDVASVLAKRGALSLTYDSRAGKVSGLDRFGVVDPWAAAVIKSRFKSGSLSLGTAVPSGGTVEDHLLRFAVDDDDNGLVKANVGGVPVTVRASAIVWCCGRDGVFAPYPFASGGGGGGGKGSNAGAGKSGRYGDDVYSWSADQLER